MAVRIELGRVDQVQVRHVGIERRLHRVRRRLQHLVAPADEEGFVVLGEQVVQEHELAGAPGQDLPSGLHVQEVGGAPQQVGFPQVERSFAGLQVRHVPFGDRVADQVGGRGGGHVAPMPERLHLRPCLGERQVLLVVRRHDARADAGVQVAGDPPFVEQAEDGGVVRFGGVGGRRAIFAVRVAGAAEALGQGRSRARPARAGSVKAVR